MQLRYFIEICRCKSVTKAAAELHISQPSLSNAIRNLEEEFGIQLFERTNNRMWLTREGEHFLVRAYELVNSADAVLFEMKSAGIERKKIRLGLTPMVGAFIFPKLCKAFSRNHPDTEFDIIEEGAIELHKLLSDDKVDVAITITSIIDEAIFRTHLMVRSQYCLCMDTHHPLAQMTVIRGNHLEGLPLALLSGNTYHSQALFNRTKGTGSTPKISVYSNQLSTIIRLVEAGTTCSFFLREAADLLPGITAVPFEKPIPADIALVWKKNKSFSNKTRQFADFVKCNFNGTT